MSNKRSSRRERELYSMGIAQLLFHFCESAHLYHDMVSSSRQILAVRIIAVSSTHSLKSSLSRNQTRLLHLVFVPFRCFKILVLSERTLSLTKSPLLHHGCWQGQSLISGCTVMTSHLSVQNYLKVNFWRSDTAFEITMSSVLTAQKTAVEHPLQRF